MTAPLPATALPVDLTVLPELTGCQDPAMLVEFMDDFLGIGDEAEQELTAAMQAADTATLKHVAHRVKSSARYVGALRLGELSEALERASAAGDTTAAPALLAQWQAEWQRVAAFLDDHLAGLE